MEYSPEEVSRMLNDAYQFGVFTAGNAHSEISSETLTRRCVSDFENRVPEEIRNANDLLVQKLIDAQRK